MTRISRNRRSRLRRRSFSRKPRTPSDSGRRISARCRDAQFNFRTGMELTPDRQFTAHKFGSFVHARQAPVSRAAVVGQNLFVHACPIIANSHLQLVLVIVDLRFDPPRLRVPEGVAQRLARNAVHFVAQYGLKISRGAFYLCRIEADGFYAERQCRSDCARKACSQGISIMPRFKAMVTAWVRSFVLSFERILLMWPLTVSSEMVKWSAMILLELPAATSRKTSISRSVNASSAWCSAISMAISEGILFRPACTLRMVSTNSFLTMPFSRYPDAPALNARTACAPPL